MISAKKSPATTPRATTRATTTTTTTTTTAPSTTPTATKHEIEDLRALCSCMTIDQINDYELWYQLGMVLKRSGAPVSLWDEVSRRSSKYKHGECAKKWFDFNRRGEGECEVTIGSLHYRAEKGNTEMYNRINPTLKIHTHVFPDEAEHPAIESDTPS